MVEKSFLTYLGQRIVFQKYFIYSCREKNVIATEREFDCWYIRVTGEYKNMHSWLITLGFAHLDLCTLM